MQRRDVIAVLSLLSVLPGLAGCVAVPPPGALDDADRQVLSRIEAYLNTIHTLRARFVQTSTQGDGRGTAWIERPGRMRLQYDPPSRVVLVAARGRVIYADAATGGSSSLPLTRTPLSMLLAERIVLSGPVTVVSLRRARGLGAALAPEAAPSIGSAIPAEAGRGALLDDALRSVEVTLRSTEHPGQGQLSLSFSDDPLRLRGLVLVDGRGETTRLSLSSVQVGVPADDSLFQFRA
jgi:outer membrane lipoprotein-sorting protein